MSNISAALGMTRDGNALLTNFRWLLLPLYALFVVGNPMFDYSPRVILLHAACAGALTILLLRMDAPASVTLWVWVMLAIFTLGYFMLTWIVARDLADRMLFVRTRYPGLQWLTMRNLVDGLDWITLAFTSFCIASSVALRGRRARMRQAEIVHVAPRGSRHALFVTAGCFLIAMLAAYLRTRIGVGIAGVDAAHLPLRIDTLLNRIVIDVAPGVTLLCIWALEKQDRRWVLAFAYVSLLVQAVIYTLWSTSRGGFIRFLLPLFFMWLIARRLNGLRLVVTATVVVATIAVFPLISYVRLMRMSGEMKLTQALGYARQLETTRDVKERTAIALTVIATRTTGADAVWTIDRYLPSEFSVYRAIELSRMPIEEFYTRQMALLADPNDHAAPGLVGTCMILGGRTGVVLLIPAFVVVVRVTWSLLQRLHTAPVALALFAMAVLAYASDGGSSPQNMVAAVLSALAVEMLYRGLMIKSPARMPAQNHPALSRAAT